MVDNVWNKLSKSIQKRRTVSSPALVNWAPSGRRLHLAENYRAIGAAKTKGVGQHGVNFALLGGVRYQVDIATLIRVVQIDSRWCHLVANRQHTENGLYRASRTQQVADHGFGRADCHLIHR